jgi:flagellar protein FliO/FliZ
VVQVAGESVLIGITEHNISMLKTLSLLDDEIPDSSPAKFGPVMHSASHLDGLIDQEEDAFEYHGLKSEVAKKIKSMGAR